MESASPRPSEAHRYRLYVDESGDHGFTKLDDPHGRCLALLGTGFLSSDYEVFVSELDRLKRDVFGLRQDKPVILHRNDITNRRGPFGKLKDAATQDVFDSRLLSLVQSSRFVLFCAVVDKLALHEKYEEPFHPYHSALALLLERYVLWLEQVGGRGDVLAEARGKEEDNQLRQAYQRTIMSGTKYIDRTRFQRVLTSQDIKIKSKYANTSGLQLADILAHPVKQFAMSQAELLPALPDNFGLKLLEAARSKWRCRPGTDVFEGYGLCWFPRKPRARIEQDRRKGTVWVPAIKIPRRERENP